MKQVGSKLHLRVLSDDSPDNVADLIHGWIDRELRNREYAERDTEITVVIGLDVK